MKITKQEKLNKLNKRNSIDKTVNSILNINESVFRKVKNTKGIGIETNVDEDLKGVDLGLSVLWSRCNLGAESETDFGDFYGWGMITPYKIGVDDTEKVYEKSTASKIQIDLIGSTDVATVKLGNGWRMPTQTELEELKNKCHWEWVENYEGSGHNGYVVTGPNGNSIFLPVAGSLYGLSHNYVGSNGSYWSSSFYSSSRCWRLYFGSSGRGMNYSWRGNGFSVRPVRA